MPEIEPPTSHLETDAALALIALGATFYFGIRMRGFAGYMRSFAEPTWLMIPLNIVEQFTRNFSLIVRLFGNVMSCAFSRRWRPQPGSPPQWRSFQPACD